MNSETEIELSIVIPVYNGASSVPKLVQALSQVDFECAYEIVLVEDCGTDDSVEVIKRLIASAGKNPALVLVELARNYGEHNAVMAGLRQARGQFVITMDDDLQNPPGEAKRLYQACRDSEADVVYTYYEEKKHSPFRNFGSWLANRTADLMFDKPRDLYLSSFRCMRRGTVDNLLRYDGPYPYVDGLISQITNRYGRLKVEHFERAEGQSGYTLKKLLRLWLSIFINFSTLPLRIASLLGLALTGFGLLLTAFVMFEYATASTPSGWASLMAAILIFSGAQLMVLGIMGEYVGRSFQYLNKKPQYAVRNVSRTS